MEKKEPVLQNRQLYWQDVGRRSAALRQGNRMLVIHRRRGEDQVELFDLATDANETTDRSAEQAPRVTAMLRALFSQQERDDESLPNDEK